MNGYPLKVGNQYAAFRRVNPGSDIRSNMHVGGKAKQTKMTDTMLEVCEVVRPKLVEDGMFLVGLDVVGDKLMEVNVFSPGGLGSCQALYGTDFAVGRHRGTRTQGLTPPALRCTARQRQAGDDLTSQDQLKKHGERCAACGRPSLTASALRHASHVGAIPRFDPRTDGNGDTSRNRAFANPLLSATVQHHVTPGIPTVSHTIFEGTSEIQQLVIARAISGLRIE